VRVLIADDQPQVRSALQLLLKQEPGVAVVGEAENVEEALELAAVRRPDLVLLDWELPGRQTAGLPKKTKPGLLPALRARCPHMKIVALSGRPEARQAALAAGADVFVSKGDPPERLLAAVDICRRRQCNQGRDKANLGNKTVELH